MIFFFLNLDSVILEGAEHAIRYKSFKHLSNSAYFNSTVSASA